MDIIAKEVSFDLNKHNKPKLLSDRESVVQLITMALFMVPGNIPSLPKVGVNVNQYLYKSSDEFNEQKLIADLEFSCGALLNGGVYITNVRFRIVETVNGPVFILAMDVDGVGEEDNTLIMGLQKKDEVVSFNYEFTNLKI